MNISNAEILSVLRQYNPWWFEGRIPDLPDWERAAFKEIFNWVKKPPMGRALILSGARQIGKTTLFLQTIRLLLQQGIPASNILYVTFDHPLFKLAGIENVIKVWREIEIKREGPEFLFLDEIQSIKDWQVWLKLQVDFEKNRHIAVTGSATPLNFENQESGVGRWHTIRLAPLSFYEFIQISKRTVPSIPEVLSLNNLFEWEKSRFTLVGSECVGLNGIFHEYLLRGGFPQCALVETVTLAQKLLREDIVDRVLKRDMTALFGVRRILELEHLFLYFCMHDGGQLDLERLCQNIQMKKPTVHNFIELLEAAHLIYKLLPYGYGKEILRSRPKIYLADAAIAPSVLLKGKALLEDTNALGRAVETAFFKHVYARYYAQTIKFSFWKGGKKDYEVDIIADIGDRLIPFEVKYQSSSVNLSELKGMVEFCKKKAIDKAYVITKDALDFGVINIPNSQTKILKIPAAFACYWLGYSELETSKF